MTLSQYLRACGFFEVYLDDPLKAELTSDERLVEEVGTVGPMQQALREVCAEWGIPTSNKKALERVPEALVRGGHLDGVVGRADPSSDKIDKALGMCWSLLGTIWPHWKQLAAAGGQLCFIFQFRRAAFCVLFHFWAAMYAERGSARRWSELAEELVAVMCLLPLLHFDFRSPVSEVISCSDASEKGGGVCVAQSLSDDGREALLRRLQPVANLFNGSLESFAGIGGGRRALDILGIRPSFYVAVE